MTKRPTPNKRPPHPPLTRTRISAHPHPTPLTPPTQKIGISTNERLLRRRSFLQSIYLLHPRVLLLPSIVLLPNKHTALAVACENSRFSSLFAGYTCRENDGNLISAHLE